jgi:Cdc6-like AAA superfamily ATPase
MPISARIPFRHPSTILVAGPTGSGKTEFLVHLLKKRVLHPFPQRVIWIYSEWQNAYDRILNLPLTQTKVQFVKNYDGSLYDSLDPKVRILWFPAFTLPQCLA